MKPAILAVDADPDVLKGGGARFTTNTTILAQGRCFSGQSKDRVPTEMLCLDLVDREAEKEIVKEVRKTQTIKIQDILVPKQDMDLW